MELTSPRLYPCEEPALLCPSLTGPIFSSALMVKMSLTVPSSAALVLGTDCELELEFNKVLVESGIGCIVGGWVEGRTKVV